MFGGDKDDVASLILDFNLLLLAIDSHLNQVRNDILVFNIEPFGQSLCLITFRILNPDRISSNFPDSKFSVTERIVFCLDRKADHHQNDR